MYMQTPRFSYFSNPPAEDCNLQYWFFYHWKLTNQGMFSINKQYLNYVLQAELAIGEL